MAHKTTHQALTKRAVKAAGNMSELAKLMAEHEPSVRRGHVDHWAKGRRKVSPRMAVAIELAVDGVVTRYQFYPEFAEGAA